MNKNTLYTSCLVLLAFSGWFHHSAWAQTANGHLRSGNKAYGKEDYPGADINYRKALDANNNDFRALYNLGDALYRQENYADAETKFQSAAQAAASTLHKAGALYNLGNARLKLKKYEEAIESYEQSLRLNPGNPNAIYNLTYAKQMLDKQQKGENNKDNKQDNDKEQDKDNKGDNKEEEQKQGGDENKDQNKDQDKGQQQDQDNKGNEGPNDTGHSGEDDKAGQAPHELGISPADARKLLEALEGEEKKVQAKMMERRGKGTKQKAEKEW